MGRVGLGQRLVAGLSLATLKALGWLYYLQPRSLREAYGCGLGFLLRRAKFRAKVVEQNLGLAYPRDDHAAETARRIGFAEAYRHFGKLVLEIVMVLGPMKQHCKRRCDLYGKEHWESAKKSGKGVIFLSSHVGNWELMAATGGLAGIDIMLVTKHLKPEWLHRAIESGRLRCGVRGTYEPRTMKDVLAHLKRNGTVGFVLDQYMGPPVGVRVPFFGVPVGTASIIATLARRTGAQVLPVVNFRDEKTGRLTVRIYPPVEWIADENPTRELALNTARYAEIVEAHVREHPDQWLWIHRRFKGDLGPLRDGEWDEARTRK